MTEKKKYDSTVARIAGNLLSNALDFVHEPKPGDIEMVAQKAVAVARAIVAEVQRPEPKGDTP